MRSLLGRQGTATALVLLCLLLSHQPSHKRSLDPHYPAWDAEPSSPMGSHRGRSTRNTHNLILHAASSPAGVHSHGFLQPGLCRGGGQILGSNCHVGRDPTADAIIKLKFSFQLLLGLGFYCTPVVFATLTRAALCWQKGPALGGLRRAGVGFFPLLPPFQPLMQKRCSSDVSLELKRILMNLQVAG